MKKAIIATFVIIFDLTFSALLIALAYIERGRFAVGGEYLPIILLVIGTVYFLIELAKAKEVGKK